MITVYTECLLLSTLEDAYAKINLDGKTLKKANKILPLVNQFEARLETIHNCE